MRLRGPRVPPWFGGAALAAALLLAVGGSAAQPADHGAAAAVVQSPTSSGAASTAVPSAQQPATAGGPPAGFVVPPDPAPGDTNAERDRKQPGNNAPFWREVRTSGEKPGFVNLPAPEAGVLIQRFVDYPGSTYTTAGEAWRQVRNQWIIPYGGALLIITVVALAIFFFVKGPMGHHDGRSGPRIERFTPFERAAHWVNAVAWVILAVSGVVIAFGKFFLLPIMGGALFGWLTYGLKNLHNFVGPLFAVSLIVLFFTFLRSNWPRKEDAQWILRAGGAIGGKDVPSHRFNAGEKIMFWGGMLLVGSIVVGSGLYLDKVLPGMDYLRSDMQVANMVHGVSAVLMMAAFFAHIYMGSIGMRGSYRAMRDGYVDEAWAEEHHKLWYEDIKRGRIPAQRSQPPGERAPDGAPLAAPQ